MPSLRIRKCAKFSTTGLVLENSGEGTWRKRKTEKLDFMPRIVYVVVMIEWQEGIVKVL